MTGEHPLSAPPILHPSCGLQRGDLFFYEHPGSKQFWLREQGEPDGEDIWTSVDIGHIRGDGRKLTVTDKRERPSWVGGDWGSKRVSASEFLYASHAPDNPLTSSINSCAIVNNWRDGDAHGAGCAPPDL